VCLRRAGKRHNEAIGHQFPPGQLDSRRILLDVASPELYSVFWTRAHHTQSAQGTRRAAGESQKIPRYFSASADILWED
jgi:hypothetical protein